RNHAFVQTVLEVTGKRVFVDTSKDHRRAVALYGAGLDVRAIHLVRDPRGVYASRLRHGVELSAREAARQWVHLHRRLERMLRVLPPDHVIRIRYEDLCHYPHVTLKQLYTFCGVKDALPLPELYSSPHHIVGNSMRLAKVSEIRVDESWRERLTRDQITDIQRVAGELCARYGYSLNY
ncbi:MAG TPA: sulfotransferase, partial [Anaerolineae bacterium]|nr:sulfotransferase [Anaerolineae bacterium]